MRLVTFQKPGAASEPGVIDGEQVVSLTGAGYADMIAVLAAGPEGLETIREYVANAPAGARANLEGVRLLAPVPRPPKVVCIGLNYRDHAIESGMEIPTTPTVFNKFPNSVIGPGDPIVLPSHSKEPDYEAELAFVIGRGGRYIAAADWKKHVYGFTNLHDVSARDYQLKTSQWLMGKTFDTFCPMGPWLVTTDEIADPHDLAISCEVSGEVLQNSNTRELIFKIPELVEYLSSVFTFEPGDVVATGTPPGVGFARKPPRYLRPGDEAIIRVEGLGELRNPVVAES